MESREDPCGRWILENHSLLLEHHRESKGITSRGNGHAVTHLRTSALQNPARPLASSLSPPTPNPNPRAYLLVPSGHGVVPYPQEGKCRPRPSALSFLPTALRPNWWRGTNGWLIWLLPQVLVPIANGTEPMEAVITIDVLRRAGADVAVASVEPGATSVAASWGIKLTADALLADLADDEFDLISLPVSLFFFDFPKWNRFGTCCAALLTGHFVFFWVWNHGIKMLKCG